MFETSLRVVSWEVARQSTGFVERAGLLHVQIHTSDQAHKSWRTTTRGTVACDRCTTRACGVGHMTCREQGGDCSGPADPLRGTLRPQEGGGGMELCQVSLTGRARFGACACNHLPLAQVQAKLEKQRNDGVPALGARPARGP